VSFPPGKALVQTLDFFTPIVNDPYRFGQIAAANSLSDVYAMGGVPWTAMNIVCFPAKTMPLSILRDILKGGLDKIREAGAVLAGGHSVEDDEIKYGLSVTGLIDPAHIATNHGLVPGDVLLLTKPLGTGVLATAVKGNWAGSERMEDLLYRWAARLNDHAGRVVRELKLKAATDVTGFGLGGHVLEMARASHVSVEITAAAVPMLDQALELAGLGLLPAGSHANRAFCADAVHVAETADPLQTDLIFDAQTSGGLVLAVPEGKLKEAVEMLQASGDLSAIVGRVLAEDALPARLTVV